MATHPRNYVGPDAATVANMVSSAGFAVRRSGRGYTASTSICHPQEGGHNINLSIRDGDNGISLKCFSNELGGCTYFHIVDSLLALGIDVWQFEPPSGRQHTKLERPIPADPDKDSHPDLAFPGYRVLANAAALTRAIPDWLCLCPTRTGKIAAHDVWQAGLHITCDQDCPLTEIYRSLTAQEWIILRHYRYHTSERSMYRLRWDYASAGSPRKVYRGAGEITGSVQLKIWPIPITDTLVIVEGEKAAESIASACTDCTAGCWPNGAETVSKVDFTQAQQFAHIILWPDNDNEGRNAMTLARQRIHHHSIATIQTDGNDKADAADLQPSVIRQIIAQHRA